MDRLPAILALLMIARVVAGEDYDLPPINYSKTPARDPAAALAAKIESGKVQLARDERQGYLPALLKQLGIPQSSQTLVFSKTSLQRQFIAPETPRAIYFNDHTYVGYVPGGTVLEIASVDPDLGTIFYTLDQKPEVRPRFVRQTHECLQCHDSTSLTGGVPGLVFRSVYPDSRGQPLFAAGTRKTTDASPIEKRWGGWYVTGAVPVHMGNLIYDETAQGQDPKALPPRDIAKCFDASLHLRGDSDAVALLVLAHQADVHNLITRANYQAKLAMQTEQEMAKALGRELDPAGLEENARIRSAGEALLKALLFVDAAPLDGLIKERESEFARVFQAVGPRDAKGRSLRDLDLKKRLLKYPCSWLIQSEQFEGLPAPMKQYVNRRLDEILSSADQSKTYSHLSKDDRAAIREILGRR